MRALFIAMLLFLQLAFPTECPSLHAKKIADARIATNRCLLSCVRCCYNLSSLFSFFLSAASISRKCQDNVMSSVMGHGPKRCSTEE
jgi:hypothetical protein